IIDSDLLAHDLEQPKQMRSLRSHRGSGKINPGIAPLSAFHLFKREKGTPGKQGLTNRLRPTHARPDPSFLSNCGRSLLERSKDQRRGNETSLLCMQVLRPGPCFDIFRT